MGKYEYVVKMLDLDATMITAIIEKTERTLGLDKMTFDRPREILQRHGVIQ